MDYRVYCLDSDGHIGFADWIEAESVEDAIKQVRMLQPHAHRCEIWHDHGLVAKLNGTGVFERVRS